MTRARSKAPASVDTGAPSAGIAFGAPPSAGPKYDWEVIAEKCKARPGEWLLVFEQDRRSVVVAVSTGSIKAVLPELGFETRTANNKRNTTPPLCDLWLRYVPKQDKSRRRRAATKKAGK